MQEVFHLDCFGLPQVRIHKDGSMYDERRDKPIVPQPSTNHIEIANSVTHERVRLSYDKVYGYFFRAPWRTGVDHKWLKPAGFSKYYVTRDGKVFSTITWNYLIGNMSFDGYLRALIKRDDGKFRTIGVHRLVAMAYIPNPDNKPEVNHIDGNKLNNCVENLEWVWGWENVEHALKSGLRKSVVDDEMIHRICKALEEGKTPKQIERECGVSGSTVDSILAGCHFRISKDYNFRRNGYFGSGHRGSNSSDECYRIARRTHGVNLQPSRGNTEGSETIPKGSRTKWSEAVALQQWRMT